MSKHSYEKVPYSFSRQKNRKEHIKNDNQCQQTETNEQSDTSELHDHSSSEIKRKNFNVLIKSLTQENEYYRSALKTAQTLISNYQKENLNLKEENTNLHQELASNSAKLQNLQRLLFKLFQCQRSTSQPQQNTKNSFYQTGKQNLNSFYNGNDNQLQSHGIQIKISKIIDQQIRYEEQIFELNKKIKMLQRMHSSDFKLAQKSKMKTSIYVPYTQTEAISQEKIKMANQLIEVYGNQKTIKTVEKKQSNFKKNLEKEFSVFLESKRNTTKSKESILKTPCHHNNRSSQNISISTEKKNCNCRKSCSIPKR